MAEHDRTDVADGPAELEPSRAEAADEPHGGRVPGGISVPALVLTFLVLVQWAAVLALATAVRHNGWLFYQGGDETFHYTAAWALAGGHVPEAETGYGWSYVLTPLAGAFGPNVLNALPLMVLLQVIVLLPLALYCVYGIAANIGGRALGYVAAVAWVALPFAVIPLWDDSYHTKYVEQFLPQAFGLTGMSDFPSLVCLLVAALFCVRTLDAETSDRRDAVLAGLAAGFAIAIKPANALFLAGPLLAFVVARRTRQGLAFGVALVPSLLALALWKYRGLGDLPALTPTPEAFAPSLQGEGPGVSTAGLVVDRYIDIDWDHLGDNYVGLRDVFFGLPVLQSLPLLGFAVATFRSWPKALLLGGWLGAFVLVKGSSQQLSIDSGDFLRLLLPGLPPLLILTALVPLILPWLRDQPPLRSAGGHRAAGAAVVAVLAVVPLVLFLVLPTLGPNRIAYYYHEDVQVPVDDGFDLEARRTEDGALLTWRAPSSPGVRTFYRVFRSRPVMPALDRTLPPDHDGVRCIDRGGPGYAGAADCSLEMTLLGSTRTTRFQDRPPPGPWVYRVALAANWRDDAAAGDILLLSTPARLS